MTLTSGEVGTVDDLDHAILAWRYARRTEAPTLDVRSAGGMTVSRLRGGPCLGWRDRRTIQAERRVYIGIGCNLGGSETCYMEGSMTRTSAGDIMMWRSDAELAFEVHDELRKVSILVPAEDFAGRYGVDRLPPAWHLRADTPMGMVASSLFTAVADQLLDLPEVGIRIALDAAIGMISRSASLDLHAGDDPREALFFRITTGLATRLGDDLAPAAIAAQHGLSLRYMQALFAEHGVTFSGWVRERRLQAAFDDVVDPVRDRSITEIAQRWRFSDGAHFSRLFKQRFGMSPRAVRAVEGAPATRAELAS